MKFSGYNADEFFEDLFESEFPYEQLMQTEEEKKAELEETIRLAEKLLVYRERLSEGDELTTEEIKDYNKLATNASVLIKMSELITKDRANSSKQAIILVLADVIKELKSDEEKKKVISETPLFSKAKDEAAKDTIVSTIIKISNTNSKTEKVALANDILDLIEISTVNELICDNSEER